MFTNGYVVLKILQGSALPPETLAQESTPGPENSLNNFPWNIKLLYPDHFRGHIFSLVEVEGEVFWARCLHKISSKR